MKYDYQDWSKHGYSKKTKKSLFLQNRFENIKRRQCKGKNKKGTTIPLMLVWKLYLLIKGVCINQHKSFTLTKNTNKANLSHGNSCQHTCYCVLWGGRWERLYNLVKYINWYLRSSCSRNSYAETKQNVDNDKIESKKVDISPNEKDAQIEHILTDANCLKKRKNNKKYSKKFKCDKCDKRYTWYSVLSNRNRFVHN